MSGEEKEEIYKLFVAIAISGGVVGGIIAALLNHYLTKDRDRAKDRESQQTAALAARVDFIGFLRGWRLDFDRLHLKIGGKDRERSVFFDSVSSFVQSAETLRGDFSKEQRKRFDSMVASISSTQHQNFDNGKRYEQFLREYDGLIAFLEETSKQ